MPRCRASLAIAGLSRMKGATVNPFPPRINDSRIKTSKTIEIMPYAFRRPRGPFMELLQHINPLFVASGFAVGFVVGLTGVGGGSLMTPILILLFGLHPVAAVGTDLIYASVTKTGGSHVHGFNRTIHWPLVARLALGSVPASLLTL